MDGEAAKVTIRHYLDQGHPLLISYSGGKDSSVVTNLALQAARELVADGGPVPPIGILHSDTGVENPEVHAYCMAELAKIRLFGEANGIPVHTRIAKPNLKDSFVTRVIGGRALPVFPTKGKRDCSVDWKSRPIHREGKALLAELGEAGWAEPVSLKGTRFEESIERGERMRERGESALATSRDGLGALSLSPIADWSTEDVWDYLGHARNGLIPSFSSFSETVRIYQDGEGSSCAVVADAQAQQRSPACGSRFGCFVCTPAGRDKSLENMLNQERYTYMRPLNKLQRFLLATQFDWDRRAWLGRTVDEAGYIRIQPDGYAPGMVEELLRYVLTIDVEEREAAEELGIAPRFQIVSAEELVMVDAQWSLFGFHRPFHALAIYDEIVNQGARYPVPEIEPTAYKPVPEARYLYLGTWWNTPYHDRYTGMRDPLLEAFEDQDSGCMGSRDLADRVIMDVETAGAGTVDPEAAAFILEYELPELLATHADPVTRTEAVRYYLRLGALQVAPAQRKAMDTILRRTVAREKAGLLPDTDPDRILPNTISAAERAAIEQAPAEVADPETSTAQLRSEDDSAALANQTDQLALL